MNFAIIPSLTLVMTAGCVSEARGQIRQIRQAKQARALPALVSQDPAFGLRAPLNKTAAGHAFWQHWGDGKAEVAAYEVTTKRYGEVRRGTSVLIFVTEPMDQRTWIKDDRGDVPKQHRVNVLKLNRTLTFQTGIYPYSVMTSTFAPVDGVGRERFAPTKISLSAQEWCGHVYTQLFPKGDRFHKVEHSYFGGEGDRQETVTTQEAVLYADALPIQLRELDGAFADGKDWSGWLVPTIWSSRKTHQSLQPVQASISRSSVSRDGVDLTRFVLRHGKTEQTFEIERAYPRRILGWSNSDGEAARLLGSKRLAYWQLNKLGDERFRQELGLAPEIL